MYVRKGVNGLWRMFVLLYEQEREREREFILYTHTTFVYSGLPSLFSNFEGRFELSITIYGKQCVKYREGEF